MTCPKHILILNDFVKDIGNWADETFGDAWRGNACFCHLIEEIKELSQDLSNQEEIADCVILLLDLAYMNTKWKKKKNICDVLSAKLSLNKKRRWGKPDKRGVIKHL